MPVDEKGPTRSERRRHRRRREFLDASQRIIAAEGFEGLTMSRLAAELDTVVSAVYRYFPSKGAMIAELQAEAIGRLAASLDAVTLSADSLIERAEVDEADAPLARLVVFGRWFCACARRYPEELRLLQLIMSQRASALDPEGGQRIMPLAMDLLGRAVVVIDRAQEAGVISRANPIERAAMWASALSGVLETDDLDRYLPDVFGGGRLALQANRDLLVGWGAQPEALARADALVDRLADEGPLAP